MMKRKVTLSLDGDLVDEARRYLASAGKSLSEVVEEYLKYLVFERWAEELTKKFDLGRLDPTSEGEIPSTRPKGFDSAKVIREIREGRIKGILNAQ